ncbi:MAG TPA: phenylalanine--tRNA ligase subunit beta [Thermodesulfovibrionales bacterium]|nr:phenylalanine--tRNA ligase subunit beta [Thermodesulfovibrionales bacterium]
MRVPLEWLKEFVDFSESPEELGDRLTMAGLEVEALEKVCDDIVFEVNVTPNRPDCLSILGIAREVSALTDLPLRFPDCNIEDVDSCGVDIEISDEDLCSRYAGRSIRGVQIKESPDWMKKRLEKCGVRPINNIVDITNYVLMEMGHPLHAFDEERLKGKKIRVGRSLPGSKITTLDGTSHALPDEALLIWDSERPVAVAGVMGGADTEVKEETTNVFLESAYFLPASVRRTSKTLGLKTEAAYRFERGTDIELLEKALDRAASMMSSLAGGKISKKRDIYPRPFKPAEIRVRYERVNKILGTSISNIEMLEIVRRLGIVVKQEAAFFVCTPPPFRGDIQKEIDIIEEVARFYGYDKVSVTSPKTPISKEGRDKRYQSILAIKESFRRSGFTEAINYSFMNYGMLDALNIGNNDQRRRALVLRNPINDEESHLRTTLVPSLIQNLVYNVSMGNREVGLFEVARVFIDRGEALPAEEHCLGALYFMEKAPSLWKEEAPAFFVVKGVVQSMLDDLKVPDYTFHPSAEPFLHPGKSSDIIIFGRRVGFLGILHPDVTEGLALRVSRPDVVIVEISLDALLQSLSMDVKYTSIPKYPHIDRDVALVVDESASASGIMDLMRSYRSELIEDISIFDFYKGKNIPEGKKSLAFAIRYRSKDRTLTDSEIEELHKRLVEYVVEKTGGIVRGA